MRRAALRSIVGARLILTTDNISYFDRAKQASANSTTGSIGCIEYSDPEYFHPPVVITDNWNLAPDNKSLRIIPLTRYLAPFADRDFSSKEGCYTILGGVINDGKTISAILDNSL